MKCQHLLEPPVLFHQVKVKVICGHKLLNLNPPKVSRGFVSHSFPLDVAHEPRELLASTVFWRWNRHNWKRYKVKILFLNKALFIPSNFLRQAFTTNATYDVDRVVNPIEITLNIPLDRLIIAGGYAASVSV